MTVIRPQPGPQERFLASPADIAIVGLGATLGYSIDAVNCLGVADLCAVADMLGLVLGDIVTATPQVRLSPDGMSWGAWQNWKPAAYTGMGFDCRVLLASTDPTVAGVLTDLTFSVDVPARTETGTDVALPAGGAAQSFATQFNGGPNGAAVPNLQVTILAAQSGDQAVVTGKTLAGFTVQIVNGGSGVARAVDWIAQGF